MDKEEFDSLEKLSDHELFDFITEKDSSQRKWIAIHLLEIRRNKVLASAAKSSAIAAWIAAAVAGVSAVIAFIGK